MKSANSSAVGGEAPLIKYTNQGKCQWPNITVKRTPNKAHGFAIFMGFVGPLHSLRSFRRRLPWALGHNNIYAPKRDAK